MNDSKLTLPQRKDLINHITSCMPQIFCKNALQILKDLPIHKQTFDKCEIPLQLVSIKLPTLGLSVGNKWKYTCSCGKLRWQRQELARH